jgi:hypothetical protein
MKIILKIPFMIIYMPLAMVAMMILAVPYFMYKKWPEKWIDFVFDLPDKIFEV